MSTFDPVGGDQRPQLDLLGEAALDPRTFAEDARRRRADFFDGRFLTARDLTREQQYALIRQADLAQAAGGGVVSGLSVRQLGNARTLQIGAGHGITPAGEVVRLQKRVTIDVRKLPSLARIDATFGLAPLPGEPTGTSSGNFVLALRPVEFTDHPTLAYPVGLDDRRRLTEGEIAEATALILIPLEQTASAAPAAQSRSELARAVFLERGLRQVSSDVLPLAVVGLEAGHIAFVDEHMVRRRAGSHSVLGFGLSQRALREAFLLQYSAQLADLETARRKAGQREPYAASEFFSVLPPFGPLPRSLVEVRDGAIYQAFFPPDMNVEITIVPQEELASLAEESLQFAPFDLRLNTTAQELCAVMLVIPMPAEAYARKIAQFRSQRRDPLEPRVNRPSARVSPIAALDALRRRRLGLPQVTVAAVDVAPWHDALAGATQLYYVRRRQLPQVSFIVPRFQEVGEADPTSSWPAATRARLVSAGELGGPRLRRFDLLLRRAPSEVAQALRDLFARALFDTANTARLEAALLINSAVAELAYRARTRLEDLVRGATFPEPTLPGSPPAVLARLSQLNTRALRLEDVAVLQAQYDLASDPDLGARGLRRLLALGDVTTPEFGTVTAVGAKLNQPRNRSVLAAALRVRDIDRLVRSMPDPQDDPDGLPGRLAIFATRLLAFVTAANLDGIWALAANVAPPALPSLPATAGR